jgi:hypothetical protein
MPNYPNVTSLELDLIGPNQLCEIVRSFESKSSWNLDGISTKLLKHVIVKICNPFAHILNLSNSTDIFPSMLKTSRTVPIFKAGSPLSCDYYRPISLLSALSKILEKIVWKQLVAHLEDNNLNINMASSTTNRHNTNYYNWLISSTMHMPYALLHVIV